MRDKFQNKGFNREMNKERTKKILKYAKGGFCLELGCGEGQITKELIKKFETVYAIDSDGDRLKYVTKKASVFKDYLENINYSLYNHVNYVVCSNILEHLDNPKKVLKKISIVGNKDSVFFFSVPNAYSANRVVGSDLGILKKPCSLGEHDIEAGHKQMFDFRAFSKLISKEFKILESGTFYYKPYPNSIMERLPADILKYCKELKVKRLGAEIFMVCVKK